MGYESYPFFKNSYKGNCFIEGINNLKGRIVYILITMTPEENKIYMNEYRKNNKERLLQQHKNYNDENKDKRKEYRKKNKEKIAEYNHKRYELKKEQLKIQ